MNKVRLLSIFSSFLLFCSGMSAQTSSFPEDSSFFETFRTRISSMRTAKSTEVLAPFVEFWNSEQMSEADKKQFISFVNKMASRKPSLYASIPNFMAALMAIRDQEKYVNISYDTFMAVTTECLTDYDSRRFSTYLNHLSAYVKEGFPNSTRNFSWKATQADPTLIFLSLEKNEQRYTAPVIRFSDTDLVYERRGLRKDSTRIYHAAGDFNLVTLTFLGNKGKGTWEKLQMDAEEVYCEFKKYKLSFFSGLIKADSTEFHYANLLDKPVLGRYMDYNSGIRDTTNTNFPFFRSYGGGVVIEDFVPGVRYEGGFSMVGRKKIGSAYDLLGKDSPSSWYESDYDFWSSSTEEQPGYDVYEEEELSNVKAIQEWKPEDEFNSLFEQQVLPYSPEHIRKHVDAKLEIMRQGKAVSAFRGEAFVLDEQTLSGNNVEASIYFNDRRDSLYQPAMNLLYTAPDSNSSYNRTIILNRPKKGNFKSIPFLSSYHRYFMYFETIIWDLETDEIAFTSLIDKENKISAIESYDYYNKGRFNRFRGVLNFNPVGAIYRYAMNNGWGRKRKDKNGEEIEKASIYIDDIVQGDRFNAKDQKIAFEKALPNLEGSGFITYDKKSKEIFPTQKLFTWSRAARGKKDFDAVQLISKVDSGYNAVLDIDSKEFRLKGVPAFSLSDSQFVRVRPLEGEVLVQGDRDLLFAGDVASGKLNLYANDEDNRPRFRFDYEGFKIHCDSLDSIRFVLVRAAGSEYKPSPLEQALSKTVFENVTGTIHIDAPNNKSGKGSREDRYAFYPVFDSYSFSYLYWNKASIQGGVYEKDKFYFSVYPFVLDSLETFDNQRLTFDGEFYSSEIFPKFEQQLTVMPDFTLGFFKDTPEEGYDIYDYKGRFFGEIALDGNGLHGAGTLEHLDARVISDSFVFHFDSVMAKVDSFSLPPSYRFPRVEGGSLVYKWYTKDERLVLESEESVPIMVFDSMAQFDGRMYLSRDGLVGDGTLRIGQVEVAGDSIVFRERDFEAKSSRFAIVDSINPDEYHFIAERVEVDYDVWRQSARFESKHIGEADAQFPIHEYKTSLTVGEYDSYEDKLEIRSTSDKMSENYFESTREGVSHVKFSAKEAFYDIKARNLDIRDVKAIFVADALIIPEHAELTIENQGEIRQLENSVIEANQETKYHRIYDATVQIISGDQYEGSGKYDYIDVKGKPQYINFENISVDELGVTTATGDIDEDQEFYLTDRIFFKGLAELNASDKFLTFEGEVKIESENPVFKGAWFQFEKTIVNPDSVYIPIPDEITNEYGDLLTVGLNFDPENRVFYSNFLQAMKDDSHQEVISASGGLTLDRKTKEFKIGSEAKIKSQSYKGSIVSFDDINNVITSQGYLNFPYNFGSKTIEMQMAGSWRDDQNKRKLSTDLLVGVSMDVVPQEPLDKLVETVRFMTASNKDIDFLQQSNLENIAEMLDYGRTGDKETEKFIKVVKNAMVYSSIDLAERFGYTVLLSNVDFDYSRDEKALFSDSKVGLIGLGGKNINKMVDAKVVYQLGDVELSGEQMPDELSIYLEIDQYNWVYFHYADQVVSTRASYQEYNQPLEELLSKKKDDDGYRCKLAPEADVKEFLGDFKIRFLNQ